jgi:hypothetical protein
MKIHAFLTLGNCCSIHLSYGATCREAEFSAARLVSRVDLDQEEDHNRYGKEDDREKKASDEELGGTFLFGTRAGDAEGVDEEFEQPGEDFHRRWSAGYAIFGVRAGRRWIICGFSRWHRGRR